MLRVIIEKLRFFLTTFVLVNASAFTGFSDV